MNLNKTRNKFLVASISTLLSYVTVAIPVNAGVYTAWWGWYQTRYNTMSACLNGANRFLRRQPELYQAGKQSPHTWANYRDNEGTAFVVCDSNGNATVMVTGTGDDYNLSRQLAEDFQNSEGR